uniref:carbonic anhydrase n=2 Tax=Chlamydomonas leiostraca TaxID=1034604 RepID=A0A7S0R8K9_9CHLO|eukprot:CAMPEP_0202864502 /NCGR_PEP_ID=MMETSP1391-20130828/4715_1 /ASSEMBLY_ACC=CAM_ASM_000867 /TAXON_ID=1034604 /ORGANISM="Chlamydomonas leiostraca, Strain SAG 11-49" /LENGTH=684 /DNA_ID=CAMNT_0049544249 /DNA_START=73 /DNA_END=2127 /DNA_ORIENTATION=+
MHLFPMAKTPLLAWALAICSSCYVANACIYKYGSEPEGLEHSAHAGTKWDYDFAGLDWHGKAADGSPWVCHSGGQQSPLNIPPASALPRLPAEAVAQLDLGVLLSNGTNIQVINNGHTIQVESSGWRGVSNITVAVPGGYQGPLTRMMDAATAPPGAPLARVTLTPVQFHFHSMSEHALAGGQSALEGHVVARVTGLPGCPPLGCFAVIGVLYAVDPDAPDADHPLLHDIWRYMPWTGDAPAYVPAGVTFNFSSLLPDDRTHAVYAGSLTTPPCTEGVLWHVMSQPARMALAQYQDFMLAMGKYSCTGLNQPTSSTSTGGTAVGGTTDSETDDHTASGSTADPDYQNTTITGDPVRDDPIASQTVWLHHGDHMHYGDIDTPIKTNASGSYRCTKSDTSFNYRMLQTRNGRDIWLAVPPPPPPSAGTASAGGSTAASTASTGSSTGTSSGSRATSSSTVVSGASPAAVGGIVAAVVGVAGLSAALAVWAARVLRARRGARGGGSGSGSPGYGRSGNGYSGAGAGADYKLGGGAAAAGGSGSGGWSGGDLDSECAHMLGGGGAVGGGRGGVYQDSAHMGSGGGGGAGCATAFLPAAAGGPHLYPQQNLYSNVHSQEASAHRFSLDSTTSNAVVGVCEVRALAGGAGPGSGAGSGGGKADKSVTAAKDSKDYCKGCEGGQGGDDELV